MERHSAERSADYPTKRRVSGGQAESWFRGQFLRVISQSHMHRYFVNIGGFQLYTYGALLALSFYLANRFGLWLGRKLGYSLEAVENSIMACILLGIVGCRLGFVIQFPGKYLANPLQILNLREGGLTIMGGVLFTVGVQGYRYWRRGQSVMNLFDFWAGPLLVGMAFGRLGCLAHGCCFGDLTSLPWGITYPEGIIPPPEPAGPRHPSQLYEMGADLLLLLFITKQQFRLRFAGQNFYTFMLGYGVIRYLDEVTRFKEGLVAGLTIYQWTSIAMAIVGLLGLLGVFGKPPVDREIFPREGPAPA